MLKEDLLKAASKSLKLEDTVRFHEICFMRKAKGLRNPPEQGLLVVTDNASHFFIGKKAKPVFLSYHRDVKTFYHSSSMGSKKISLELANETVYITLLPREFDSEELIEFMKEMGEVKTTAAATAPLEIPASQPLLPPPNAPIILDSPPPSTY